MDNQELTHHGIKGMKWGVRKAQSDSPKAKRADRSQKLGKKGKVTIAAIAGTAVVAVGAALVAKKLKLKNEIARDFASADRIMKGRSAAREFGVDYIDLDIIPIDRIKLNK